MNDRDPISEALDIFREALSAGELAGRLSLTPDEARRLWQQVRRRLVQDNFNEAAAREFAAETGEVLGALEQKAVQEILRYNGGADKLTGLAAMLKIVKEMRMLRIEMLQQLGLLPNKGKSHNLPDPEAIAPRAPTAEEIRSSIEALQGELQRIEALPPSSTSAVKRLPPGQRKDR